MKIAICGINGLVGKALEAHFLQNRTNEVVGVRVREHTSVEEVAEAIEGAEVVINLAGTTILARWSEAYKKTLYTSRIDTTRKLVEAMKRVKKTPDLFLSTSAVGIYDGEHQHDESSPHLAEDFLSILCRDWEAEAHKAAELGMRVVTMRFGVVYTRNGGAMAKMLLPFQLGLGGRVGSGEQMISWIHLDDLVAAVDHLIRHPEAGGVVNMTAPYPISNKEQAAVMGEMLKRPTFFPVPGFVLKLIFGEGSTVMLDSKEVYPKALLESGFVFRYPRFDTALDEIVH